MAKLVITYENDIEKLELTFRNETYSYSMLPTNCGRKGDKPSFDTQIGKAHPELAEDDDLMELLGNLSFEEGGSEILEILEQLEDSWEASTI